MKEILMDFDAIVHNKKDYQHIAVCTERYYYFSGYNHNEICKDRLKHEVYSLFVTIMDILKTNMIMLKKDSNKKYSSKK